MKRAWERGGESFFDLAVQRVAIAMTLADDFVDADELDTVRRVVHRLTGKPISEGDLDRNIDLVEHDREELLEFLAEAAPSLDEKQRVRVLQAGCMVARADGRIIEAERTRLLVIGAALGLSAKRAAEVITAVESRG